ncbi:MAG: aldehyde dehydrogenase family protein, partial [Anaerolineales bacterium]
MTEKKEGSSFQLTYATMFEPPEELHERYEAALEEVKAKIGLTHKMIIDGKEVEAQETFEDRSPIDTDLVLGVFQKGNQTHAGAALEAARKAFPEWSRRPWTERVELMRKVCDKIDERIYEIAAIISLEVGKNRMEALGDIAEVSALIRYACDQMEENNGFIVKMGQDPLKGYTAINTSVLRPYGVWLVISPFNFPAALTGGPSGAALVAGNTIVIKPA